MTSQQQCTCSGLGLASTAAGTTGASKAELLPACKQHLPQVHAQAIIALRQHDLVSVVSLTTRTQHLAQGPLLLLHSKPQLGVQRSRPKLLTTAITVALL